MFHVCVIRPPEIYVNLVLNIFTLLVVIQYVDNLFNLLSSVRTSPGTQSTLILYLMSSSSTIFLE